jgi:cytoskeletal protein RodZ
MARKPRKQLMLLLAAAVLVLVAAAIWAASQHRASNTVKPEPSHSATPDSAFDPKQNSEQAGRDRTGSPSPSSATKPAASGTPTAGTIKPVITGVDYAGDPVARP